VRTPMAASLTKSSPSCGARRTRRGSARSHRRRIERLDEDVDLDSAARGEIPGSSRKRLPDRLKLDLSGLSDIRSARDNEHSTPVVLSSRGGRGVIATSRVGTAGVSARRYPSRTGQRNLADHAHRSGASPSRPAAERSCIAAGADDKDQQQPASQASCSAAKETHLDKPRLDRSENTNPPSGQLEGKCLGNPGRRGFDATLLGRESMSSLASGWGVVNFRDWRDLSRP
jgi:hypothetical protein